MDFSGHPIGYFASMFGYYRSQKTQMLWILEELIFYSEASRNRDLSRQQSPKISFILGFTEEELGFLDLLLMVNICLFVI